MSQQEQKPQWFWCNKHGDFAVRPICPECEHLGQAFTSSVTPAPPEASHAEAERDQQAGALVTLRAERDQFKAALGRYGRHDDDCPRASASTAPCNCGLTAARFATPVAALAASAPAVPASTESEK